MTLATIWAWLFPLLTALLALGWLWQAIDWLLHFSRVPDLNRLYAHAALSSADPQPPAHALPGPPQLTVVIPACNEQASIEATLRSLLASTGLRLQIIAVDDRSTDRTGAIIDRIAADFSAANSLHTLQVLHIRQLPAGWLGKPHALATAANLAQAPWILFTDGDVHFAPHAAAWALRYLQSEQADHLVLMPDWITSTHGEAAMHGAMHALSTWTLRLWRIADPNARDFLGVGAFNLVRRQTYEALGGFTSLRMEVLEDLRLGWHIKRGGYRQRVAIGAGLASLRWCDGAWGVVRNLEKNLFALYRYRIALALFACLGLALQILWPIAAIVSGGPARWAAVALYAAIALVYLLSRQVTRVPARYVLVFPFAASLFLFAMLRSIVLTLVRGGVLWRGTLYSIQELRAHAGKFW